MDPADPNSVRPDIYTLVKFQRLEPEHVNERQKPIVQPGDQGEGRRRDRGWVLATETGELALGQNVVVARSMPWGGYNFEDSILINEKLVKNDVFTSIHIEEAPSA